jgi:hypothetical protein
MPDANKQAVALFSDGWDSSAVVLLEHETTAAGRPGPATARSAAIVDDGLNRVAIDTGVPEGGGYLVLLDTFTDDWRVSVDGEPAEVVRANGLFRAVRLVPGSHRVGALAAWPLTADTYRRSRLTLTGRQSKIVSGNRANRASSSPL